MIPAETTAFLNGRVTLHAGDCLDRIRLIPDASIDSVVTDPPYALVSITKRFGKAGSAPVVVPEGKSGAYARASAGFMGKAWDVGDRAFAVEFWSEVYRVLKPGGHVLAFGGTRTVHRLTCAIEDAGFEIRDMAAWMYGSGFPKSHDVAKGIDRARNDGADGLRVGAWLKQQRIARGLKQKAVAALWPSSTGGLTGCVANWETLGKVPTLAQWSRLKSFIGFGDEMDGEVWRLNGRKGNPGDNWNVIGERDAGAATGGVYGDFAQRVQIVDPTESARQWEGWGTALKPAMEPITMARKPLAGTVAENVLTHGTGALNIAGCRIPGEPVACSGDGFRTGKFGGQIGHGETTMTGEAWASHKAGRWPANVIHDGSDEVVAAFPITSSGSVAAGQRDGGKEAGILGAMQRRLKPAIEGSTGSAARFFYNAKADSDDRIGSKHPTVKPVDLMRYLVRLVTPPGGIVLDPFAGTGTTGEAAFREGFSAILIEREDEYRADIARRMELVLAGPDQRRHAIVKAKGKPDDLTGTLFAAPAMAAE